MAATVKNVYAAAPLVLGSLRVGPTTTTAPTDASTALDVGFVDLGYISDTGFVKKLDRQTTQKRAFGGKIVKTLQSSFTTTVTVTMLESLNATALKAVYGTNNVTTTSATSEHGTQIKVNVNSIKLPHQSWVIDTTDEELGGFYRVYLPDGQITTVGDIKIVHTDTIEYNVTITCYDDATGNQAYTFTDNGIKSGS
jgi:hypothetical protein